jgi:DNA-binding transcriptional ArsR family regulator
MPDASRRVGPAFLAALSHEGPGEDLEVAGPSLANARRRQVFRYLCLRPCARVGEIGRALSMSQATVRWHERNLLENGYIEMDGARVFPQGLIDPADAPLFALLGALGRDAALAAVVAEPGIALQDLASRVGLTRQSASKAATELSEFGLLSVAEDGRFRRLYATDVLGRKRDANAARVESFVDRLLRRLTDDGLSPELLRRDEAVALVRLGAGPRRVVLDLSVDPYRTAWQSRL